MNRLGRVLTIAAIALGVAASSTACASKPAPDEIYLRYTNGIGDNRAFKQCVPGGGSTITFDDDLYALPTNVRTWNVAPSGGDTNEAVRAGSKPKEPGRPGPEVDVWVKADFYIDTDCTPGKNGQASPAQRFWESLGRRYGVSSDKGEFSLEGFRTALKNSLVPVEYKSIREASRNFDSDDLDANTNGVWGQMEDLISPMLAEELRNTPAGVTFCGAGYSRDPKTGKPVSVKWEEPVRQADGSIKKEKRTGTCPPVRVQITDINLANKNIVDARAEVIAAQERAKAALIDAEGKKAAADKLAAAGQSPGYVELQRLETQRYLADKNLKAVEACAKNPKCTVIVDGASSGVNVNAG